MINSLEDLKGLRIVEVKRLETGKIRIVVMESDTGPREAITFRSCLGVSASIEREVVERRVATIYLD